MVAGYGATKAWIQEYEYLLKRPLKKFTVVDPSIVHKFEVSLILRRRRSIRCNVCLSVDFFQSDAFFYNFFALD